jgi:hypothetical protein
VTVQIVRTIRPARPGDAPQVTRIARRGRRHAPCCGPSIKEIEMTRTRWMFAPRPALRPIAAGLALSLLATACAGMAYAAGPADHATWVLENSDHVPYDWVIDCDGDRAAGRTTGRIAGASVIATLHDGHGPDVDLAGAGCVLRAGHDGDRGFVQIRNGHQYLRGNMACRIKDAALSCDARH